ncbi:MAG: class II aldolase/adducin family protein [Candidatus Velthaea sp.]
MTLIDAAPELVNALVTANRILYSRGVVDGFGHVSVRHDRFSDRFLLARNRAPALVTAEDIMTFGLDGTPAGNDARKPYLERFLHGAIYRARPDVGAVVHSHSEAVIPFGIVPGTTLRAVFHMASFLGSGTPVFEIRDTAGLDSDMLITSPALGEALARTLGAGPVVLMRGHGSTAVGRDVREAVFRAVYTEINAGIQADASHLGPVTALTEREAERSAATNATQIDRAWEFWAREAS